LGGVYPQTYWTSRLRKAEHSEQDLADALRELIHRLSPFRDFFESIRTTGGNIEFFIGWFFYHNSGAVIEPELLARLAGLGIALSLDVYDAADQKPR
jgi:hypothetical protein